MITKFTVTRIDVDYYTIQEQDLIETRTGTKWEQVTRSWGGQWPEYEIPEPAQKRNPRTALRNNGDSYSFVACMYDFPEPRLMGKFADYTSAYGWEDK